MDTENSNKKQKNCLSNLTRIDTPKQLRISDLG